MATKLPKAAIIRMFKEAGAERVSGNVAGVMNNIVSAIAKGAVKSTKASGRKTVSADDLRLVVVSS
jgi:histone H3/H4